MTCNNPDIDKSKPEGFLEEAVELIEKIDHAYRILKLSQRYLDEVADDYGKLKIARLRLDFARHELETLLETARGKGAEWRKKESADSLTETEY